MYRIEWIWPVAVFGVLTLPMVPWFGALLAVLMVLTVAAAILVALVGAILAPPFLLARAVHRHWRSGGAQPVDTAQATASRAPLLTGRGPQTAAPEARAALAGLR
jgi:hypothetical protein